MFTLLILLALLCSNVFTQDSGWNCSNLSCYGSEDIIFGGKINLNITFFANNKGITVDVYIGNMFMQSVELGVHKSEKHVKSHHNDEAKIPNDREWWNEYDDEQEENPQNQCNNPSGEDQSDIKLCQPLVPFLLNVCIGAHYDLRLSPSYAYICPSAQGQMISGLIQTNYQFDCLSYKDGVIEIVPIDELAPENNTW